MTNLKNKLKTLKSTKGSELVEKILMVAVSIAVGAVVVGAIWGIVNKYKANTAVTNTPKPDGTGNYVE